MTDNADWMVFLGRLFGACIAAISATLQIPPAALFMAAIGGCFSPIVGADKPFRKMCVDALLSFVIGLCVARVAALMWNGFDWVAAFGGGLLGPTIVARARELVADFSLSNILSRGGK